MKSKDDKLLAKNLVGTQCKHELVQAHVCIGYQQDS